MGILIDNRQSRHKIDLNRITNLAQVILDDLDSHDAELSLVIVNDGEIAELNQRYLNREGPTNVIAFPMRTDDFPEVASYLIGDVVISADTAEKESQIAGISMQERLVELLIHGILHLFGFDHEFGGAQAVEMERKSKALKQLVHHLI